jgi:hypothetical protein
LFVCLFVCLVVAGTQCVHAKGLVLCGIGGKRVVGEHLDVSPVVQYLGNLMYQVSYQHYNNFKRPKKKI